MRQPSSPSSPTTSRTAATAGRGLPTPMRRAGGWPKRSTAARNAWASPDLSGTDEQAIWARYGSQLHHAPTTTAASTLCCSPRRPDDAARFITAWPARSGRRPLRARIAMQRNSADAESRYQAVIGTVTSDAGLMMDRARYLRANNYDQLGARSRRPPSQFRLPARRSRALLRHAARCWRTTPRRTAQWQTAFNIARQLDDVFPPGADVADQPLGDPRQLHEPRLARRKHRARPLNGRRARSRCSTVMRRAGRSLQVQTKGYYWAGRAALAAGHLPRANAYFQRAAAYPELFYGQLALERLGRSVSPPPQALPQYVTTPRSGRRSTTAGWSRRCGCSSRASSTEQALFVQGAGRIARQRRRPQPRGRARPADQPPGSARCGPRAWRGSKDRCSTSARPIRACRPRSQPTCGRWRTASAARKARSILMRSAMPARAA